MSRETGARPVQLAFRSASRHAANFSSHPPPPSASGRVLAQARAATAAQPSPEVRGRAFPLPRLGLARLVPATPPRRLSRDLRAAQPGPPLSLPRRRRDGVRLGYRGALLRRVRGRGPARREPGAVSRPPLGPGGDRSRGAPLGPPRGWGAEGSGAPGVSRLRQGGRTRTRLWGGRPAQPRGSLASDRRRAEPLSWPRISFQAAPPSTFCRPPGRNPPLQTPAKGGGGPPTPGGGLGPGLPWAAFPGGGGDAPTHIPSFPAREVPRPSPKAGKTKALLPGTDPAALPWEA